MKFTSVVKIWTIWTLKPISWSKYFTVKDEFNWRINYETKTNNIIVPEWFKTDLWSIPRICRWIFNPNKYISYILHDYMRKYLNKSYTTKEIDLILLEALTVERACKLERCFIYCWVRIGAFLGIWIYK